jgi:hypothetical protein
VLAVLGITFVVIAANMITFIEGEDKVRNSPRHFSGNFSGNLFSFVHYLVYVCAWAISLLCTYALMSDEDTNERERDASACVRRHQAFALASVDANVVSVLVQ